MFLAKELTDRGFQVAKFTDLYGSECSIQVSSLATEPAIWFGVDQHYYEGPSTSGRMHLTEDMVKILTPLLLRFLEFGDLWPPDATHSHFKYAFALYKNMHQGTIDPVTRSINLVWERIAIFPSLALAQAYTPTLRWHTPIPRPMPQADPAIDDPAWAPLQSYDHNSLDSEWYIYQYGVAADKVIPEEGLR
jgi:hypothetical protein